MDISPVASCCSSITGKKRQRDNTVLIRNFLYKLELEISLTKKN